MSRWSTLTTVIVLLSIPATAHADSPFNGFSIGGNVGLAKNQAKNPISGVDTGTVKKNGKEFRGFVGYDTLAGDNFVVGGELGLATAGPTVTWSNDEYSYRADPKLAIDASLRAGILVTDYALFYGRVGYANASVKTSLTTPSNSDVASNSKRKGGVLFGGGVEFAVSDSLSLRGEILKKDLGKIDSKQLLFGAALRF